VRFQGEVAGVEAFDQGVRIVAAKRLGTRRDEKRITLALDCNPGRLVLAEEFLESRIERDVGGAGQEKLGLDLLGSGAPNYGVVERVGFRRHRVGIRHAAGVLPARAFAGENLAQTVAILGRRLSPLTPKGIPMSPRLSTYTSPFSETMAVMRLECAAARRQPTAAL
jgi:hypothetical protein